MTRDDQLKLVADFIRAHTLAVVSSIWQGKPQSAVVVFSQRGDVELIFGTNNDTRKYRNLKADPHCAVVVGWDENITVQYEGVASEVSQEDFARYREIHLEKNPGCAMYAYLDTQRYFKLTPLWIRYSDFSQNPEFIFELVF